MATNLFKLTPDVSLSLWSSELDVCYLCEYDYDRQPPIVLNANNSFVYVFVGVLSMVI